MEKSNELLEEELDIIKIIKSIRILKKEETSKFMIDLDDDVTNLDISHFDNS